MPRSKVQRSSPRRQGSSSKTRSPSSTGNKAAPSGARTRARERALRKSGEVGLKRSTLALGFLAIFGLGLAAGGAGGLYLERNGLLEERFGALTPARTANEAAEQARRVVQSEPTPTPTPEPMATASLEPVASEAPERVVQSSPSPPPYAERDVVVIEDEPGSTASSGTVEADAAPDPAPDPANVPDGRDEDGGNAVWGDAVWGDETVAAGGTGDPGDVAAAEDLAGIAPGAGSFLLPARSMDRDSIPVAPDVPVFDNAVRASVVGEAEGAAGEEPADEVAPSSEAAPRAEQVTVPVAPEETGLPREADSIAKVIEAIAARDESTAERGEAAEHGEVNERSAIGREQGLSGSPAATASGDDPTAAEPAEASETQVAALSLPSPSLPSLSLPPLPRPRDPHLGDQQHLVYEEPFRLSDLLPAPSAAELDAFVQEAGLSEAPPPSSTEGLEQPWQRHAVQTAATGDRPMIAVVIDDLGLNRPNTRKTVDLPAPLTLAFMTYAEGIGDILKRSRERGHELLVHMPMEPGDPRYDPGPNALRAGMKEEELRRRIDWGLKRFDGYVGINNHMGSKFTASLEGMAVVMVELRKRGLLYLDSVTAGGSVGAGLAERTGVPFAVRDVFIDNDHGNPAAIRRRLAEAERIAKRRGYAVAIGHPHRSTIEALRAWLPGLAARGFDLVPISAVVQRRIAIAAGKGDAG